MKQTKEILRQLESVYSNIDYYQLIVEKIEKNVDKNPDIAIESCKSLIEGISKFILKQLDSSIDSAIIENFKYARAVEKAIKIIGDKNPNFELEFAESLIPSFKCIATLRNDRGDISHGKLSPKEFNSKNLFSRIVMDFTDSILFYMLTCFSQVEIKLPLEFDLNPEFNKWLDEENPFGNLSYSRALFDQDLVAYEQELINYKDLQEASNG